MKAPVAASASKKIAAQIPCLPSGPVRRQLVSMCLLTVSVTPGEISLGHLDILRLSFYLLYLSPSIKTSNLTTSYVSPVQGASPGQGSGSGQVQSSDSSME